MVYVKRDEADRWVAVAKCRDMHSQSEARGTAAAASAEAVAALQRLAGDLGRDGWF